MPFAHPLYATNTLIPLFVVHPKPIPPLPPIKKLLSHFLIWNFVNPAASSRFFFFLLLFFLYEIASIKRDFEMPGNLKRFSFERRKCFAFALVMSGFTILLSVIVIGSVSPRTQYNWAMLATSLPVAQWSERPTGVRKVWFPSGLRSFLCPTLATCWTFHLVLNNFV